MPRFDCQSNGFRVFVGGIDPRVGKVDIERKFQKFGTVTDVWVARKPPGFAFIVFKYSDDADRAVRQMDGEVEHAVNNKSAHVSSRRTNRSRSRSFSRRRPYSPVHRRRSPARRSSQDYSEKYRRRQSPTISRYNKSRQCERNKSRSPVRSSYRSRIPRSRSPSQHNASRCSSTSQNSKKNNYRFRSGANDRSRSHSRNKNDRRGNLRSPLGSECDSPNRDSLNNHDNRRVSRSSSSYSSRQSLSPNNCCVKNAPGNQSNDEIGDNQIE